MLQYSSWLSRECVVHVDCYFSIHVRWNRRRIALKIAYLGWDYHGFAIQEQPQPTIEVSPDPPISIALDVIGHYAGWVGDNYIECLVSQFLL